MDVRGIIGIGVGIIVLAGISVAIINGGQTANIIGTSGKAFAGLITAATNPGRA